MLIPQDVLFAPRGDYSSVTIIKDKRVQYCDGGVPYYICLYLFDITIYAYLDKAIMGREYLP